MINLDLIINSRLDVLWKDQIYKSVVQDLQNGEVIISIPVYDGVYLTLPTGQEIEEIYYDDKGNVFNFKCKILGRVVDNRISFYRLSEPYGITKIQRRDYVRVNVTQVVNYIKEEEFKKNFEVEDRFQHALLLDLSGGGMRIKIKEDLDYGTMIISNLQYKEEKAVVIGKIVRKEKSDDKRYICGVTFDDIDNSTREKVIRMVFSIMRKQRELA